MNTGRILFGGLAALDRELKKELWQGCRYTILVDENTFQCCLPRLVSKVEALQEADFIEVPVGEECKTLEVAAQVWQTLLEGEVDRDAVLVCLGGGTVCDLGGFVAAGYKRGIRHINVPTTVLAMADAAIGGKTAIDFGGVKNSIGHFYPAILTVIEPAFKETLSPVEILCGQFEMLKTALVTDEGLCTQLMGDDCLLDRWIKEVARIKQRVVKVDPYDHSIRRILNFGHTFGHAIEVYCGLPHGIAVGIGMKAAMYLSVKKVGLQEENYNAYSQWLKATLEHFNFQLSTFNLKDIEQMLPLMHHDKKNAEGTIRCVLLKGIGLPIIDVDISDHEVRDALLKVAR